MNLHGAIDLEKASRVITGQERVDRLTELAMTLRVWPGDTDGSNLTLGLIELCEEWLGSDNLGELSMVEIGSFAGVSTEVFALFAKTVFAVDIWKPPPRCSQEDLEMIAWAERTFRKRMMPYPSVRVIREPSVKAAERFRDGVLDAVYIDGDHDEKNVRADVAAWRPKLKPGGLLMGHDYLLAKVALDDAEVKVYQDSSWVVLPEAVA